MGEIRQVTNEIQPYVGPSPFTEKDKEIFFGRERETNDILSFVVAHQAVLLYAQSGAGKTSLINAGLIPCLKEEGFEVFPPTRVRGPILEDVAPEDIPNVYVFNTLINWAKEEPDTKRLARTSLAEFLKERGHPTDREGEPMPRVLIFDQFEELFTAYQAHWKEREGFFNQVQDALKEDSLLRVVFAIREEHIARLDSYAHLLPEKLRTRFHLKLLREGAACEAIKKPPEKIGCSFDSGVADKLLLELMKTQVEDLTGNLKWAAESL